MPDSTSIGAVIFGKNSDRPNGEDQVVETHSAKRHPAGSTVRCTYLEIPQAPKAFAVILSRPRWMWGAEMGAGRQQHWFIEGPFPCERHFHSKAL